jgi:putative flippase GtrA
MGQRGTDLSAVDLPLAARLRGSWRVLVKELTAFGAVGFVSLLIDLSIYNILLHKGFGPLTAKLVSTTVATVVAYLGNRSLSFSHRARSSLKRETGFFVVINVIALIFALVVLAIFAYPLGYKHDTFVTNVVNLFTIGIGTIFRFWAYKRFVFLHPDRAVLEASGEDPLVDAV